MSGQHKGSFVRIAGRGGGRRLSVEPVPTPVTMGLGAYRAIESSPFGTVIAAFDRAVYLRLANRVVALTAPSVPLGPLHVRLPRAPAGLGVGDTFHVPDEWRYRPTIWTGQLPDRSTIGADVLRALGAVACHSPLLAPPLARRWRAASRARDLAQACQLLGGLGPGLTPSGDDALAGMLLAARLHRPEAEDDLVALADGVETHEISRAFLHWAARGQSVEPVHRLLAGDATAGADLLANGHSSGADLALGLGYGLAESITGPWPGTPWFAPLAGG